MYLTSMNGSFTATTFTPLERAARSTKRPIRPNLQIKNLYITQLKKIKIVKI